MPRPFLTLLLAALTCFFSKSNATPPPLLPAQECSPRAGLPNFLAKAKQSGATLKVAYLGGSITAQPGWRVQSLAHIQSLFPNAKFTEIFAAVGGTGSELGAFRLKQDVLNHQPDLLFIEFAVNDWNVDPDQVKRSMEGIIRQTWHAFPKCDICFVYTLTERISAPLIEGKFPATAGVMEQIADYHQIPTIHMAMEVARLAKEKKLIWSAPLPKTPEEKAALGDQFIFAPDSVHPYESTGHKLYTEAIIRSFPKIINASGNPLPHKLSAPLIEGHYENAKLIPIGEIVSEPSFTKLAPDNPNTGRFTLLQPIYRATKPGTKLSFRFRGTRAAIYDIVGPDSGNLSLTLDDQPPRTVPRFDSYANGYRLNLFHIAANLPDTEHTVKIEILAEQPDKAAILAKQNKKMDDPKRFDGTAFYPGALLILGDLVK